MSPIPCGEAPSIQGLTVSVPSLDDGHDDDGETLTLSLSNPVPAAYVRLGDAATTSAISNDDSISQASMARFARTVADQVVDAVQGQLQAASAPGREMVLAGIQLSDGTIAGGGLDMGAQCHIRRGGIGRRALACWLAALPQG